jgi:hypothetical protein
MAEIEGSRKLIAQMRAKQREALAASQVSVSVGFTQNYAIYVHENLMAKHPVGQAKFLEQPFRELSPELGGMVREVLQQGRSMSQALLIAGLRLQRESQLLVPVLTGALKGSAFTRLDSGDATATGAEEA